MDTAPGPRPPITVETTRQGLADIAGPASPPPAQEAGGDTTLPTGVQRGVGHPLLAAGGALAAYTGIAEPSPHLDTFDGGDAD